MGSNTKSISNTSYLNTPLTLDNNQNGLALAGNTGLQLGGFGNVSGATRSGNNSNNTVTDARVTDNSKVTNSGYFQTNNSTLDAGAIERAFSFGEKSVSNVLDLTAKLIDAKNNASVANLGFAEKQEVAAAVNNPELTKAKGDYKNAIMIALAVAVGYFVLKGKF